MNLLDLYAKVSIDTSDYERGLDRASGAAEDFGEHVDESGRKVEHLGPLTVAAGEMIAGAFQAAARAVKDFASYAMTSSISYESAFAKVSTIMDDTQVASGDMSAAILDLSSKMGISADDISNSVYDVISATGDTAHAVSLVESATKLAKGGFAETGDAVSVLTTAINAYGMSMEDANKISDSLITVQNLGVTTVGELSSAMGKAIATGAAYGVNLSNLETGYIALTKSGIGTAESTTYLSAMMNELGKDGSDVSKVLKTKTGKSFGQLMESGYSLADVLGILNESVDGNSEAMMNLWGSAEAGKAAASIVGQGLEEFNGWLQEVESSAGATETAYTTMSQTTEGQMDILKTSFQNLLIEGIQPVKDKFSELVPAITEAIQNFDIQEMFDKLASLKELLEKYSPLIAGITAAILAYEAAQAAAAAITAVKTAMDAAGTTTLWGLAAAQLAANAPLLAVVGVIGAVVAAGVALYKNWDTVKEKVTEFVDKAKAKFEDFKNSVKTSFDTIKNNIANAINTAKEKVHDAIEKIKSFFKFEWSLPKLKMPHLSITGSFSILPPSVPSFSIQWYRKAYDSAMVLNNPTIFGTQNGQLLGGGEGVGAEVIAGEEHLMGMISSAVGSVMGEQLSQIYALLAEYIPQCANSEIYLDGQTLVGGIAPAMDDELGRLYTRRNR